MDSCNRCSTFCAYQGMQSDVQLYTYTVTRKVDLYENCSSKLFGTDTHFTWKLDGLSAEGVAYVM